MRIKTMLAAAARAAAVSFQATCTNFGAGI